MALRDQPYLPLYVQDYLTDEKLNMCSPSAQGVYIKIMCVLHKQDTYGEMTLFKQKDKQSESTIRNFALKFAKLLPFPVEVIFSALEELVDEKVLIIDGDKISQLRMVKDNAVSQARSRSGKKGGGNPALFKQIECNQYKQRDKQNTEYENEYENDNINDINFSLLLSFLDTAVNSLPEDKACESRIFHDAVYDLLLEQGYECKYEYPIPNGRIDILVILPNDVLVAIELDNRTPRSKNILKTEGLNMRFISILRDPYPNKSYSQFNIDGVVQYKKKFTGSLEPVEEYEFYPFEEFWNDYDKKVGEKEKLSRKWEKVSIKDRKAIKEYIPKYKAHQPDKKFRKNPETFLNNKSWNDELIPSGAQSSKPKGVTIVQSQEIYNELNGKQ